ncbi:hypothetical protein C8F01DRAFT_1087972 [Mycena amicta]|nr:hypothetical protein C8F01DRAFT_1087972 [Mycena amicta]
MLNARRGRANPQNDCSHSNRLTDPAKTTPVLNAFTLTTRYRVIATLGSPIRIQITVFTKEFGGLPDFYTSRQCPACKTRYYPNYFIDAKANRRIYYAGDTIEFMQIAGHFYMHRDIAEMFASMQVNPWTSGTNCAKIYNESMKDRSLTPFLPADWGYTFNLDVEKVWNAFFLHGLLLDVGSGSLERMAGPGQDEWNHACDACTWYTEDNKGNLGL